ncbi:MAG: SH3-like domain-containing protein [Bacteroidia bacterium]
MKLISLVFTLSVIVFGCKQSPEVQYDSIEKVGNSKVKSQNMTDEDSEVETHIVEVLEILQAESNTYLHVKENEKTFWIATVKAEYELGSLYEYGSGLRQEKFESKQLNRVFDELFLVSIIKPISDTEKLEQESEGLEKNETEKIEVNGSRPISDILENAKDLEGEIVTVSGNVVKLNEGILGYNWVHLQDGSKNDFDLVVTTKAKVQPNQTVTFIATLTLNKDFGAGYIYDIILENGELTN